MRYLMLTKNDGREPDAQLFADMAKFVEELTAEGILLATGGLDPVGRQISSAVFQVFGLGMELKIFVVVAEY